MSCVDGLFGISRALYQEERCVVQTIHWSNLIFQYTFPWQPDTKPFRGWGATWHIRKMIDDSIFIWELNSFIAWTAFASQLKITDLITTFSQLQTSKTCAGIYLTVVSCIQSYAINWVLVTIKNGCIEYNFASMWIFLWTSYPIVVLFKIIFH